MSNPALPSPALPRRLWIGLNGWLSEDSNRRELAIIHWGVTISLIACGTWVEVVRRLPLLALLVRNDITYAGVIALITNVLMLILMYRRRGRQSDRFKAATGVLMIVCASLYYAGLEDVYARNSHLLVDPSIPAWFKVLITFLAPLKYLFGFGVAAIGAGIFSGIISRERSGPHMV